MRSQLLRCMSFFMAHSVSWRGAALCPVLGADRNWLAETQTVAFDPQRSLGVLSIPSSNR
jgi:hypothetical protein